MVQDNYEIHENENPTINNDFTIYKNVIHIKINYLPFTYRLYYYMILDNISTVAYLLNRYLR
jgi:hypothetical protein